MNKRKRPDAPTSDPRKPLSRGSFFTPNYKLNSAKRQEARAELYFWIALAVLVAALIAGQLWI